MKKKIPLVCLIILVFINSYFGNNLDETLKLIINLVFDFIAIGSTLSVIKNNKENVTSQKRRYSLLFANVFALILILLITLLFFCKK